MHRPSLLASLVFALFALGLVGCASEVGNDGAMVGGSCVVSGECANTSRCLTGEAWPEGYCVSSCDSDEDCADGAVCVENEGGICLVACTGDADCRSGSEEGDQGYTCVDGLESRGAGGTVMGCLAE